MINNIIIQFIEEIKKNIKFFEGNSEFLKLYLLIKFLMIKQYYFFIKIKIFISYFTNIKNWRQLKKN